MSSPILPPAAVKRRTAGLGKCAPSPAERRSLSCSRFRPSCRRDEPASNKLNGQDLFRDPYSVTPSIHLKLLITDGHCPMTNEIEDCEINRFRKSTFY